MLHFVFFFFFFFFFFFSFCFVLLLLLLLLLFFVKFWIKAFDWVFFFYLLGVQCLVQFFPGYMCWTTIMFGTQKNSSLKINSLPLNICLNYKHKHLARCQNWYKKRRFFVKKLKYLYISDHTIWFNSRQHVIHVRIKK